MLQRRKLHVIYGISNADYAFCAVVGLKAKLHRSGICKQNVSDSFSVPRCGVFILKIEPRHLLFASVKRNVKACTVGDENNIASKKVIVVLFERQNRKPSRCAKQFDGKHLRRCFNIKVTILCLFTSQKPKWMRGVCHEIFSLAHSFNFYRADQPFKKATDVWKQCDNGDNANQNKPKIHHSPLFR